MPPEGGGRGPSPPASVGLAQRLGGLQCLPLCSLQVAPELIAAVPKHVSPPTFAGERLFGALGAAPLEVGRRHGSVTLGP